MPKNVIYIRCPLLNPNDPQLEQAKTSFAETMRRRGSKLCADMGFGQKEVEKTPTRIEAVDKIEIYKEAQRLKSSAQELAGLDGLELSIAQCMKLAFSGVPNMRMAHHKPNAIDTPPTAMEAARMMQENFQTKEDMYDHDFCKQLKEVLDAKHTARMKKDCKRQDCEEGGIRMSGFHCSTGSKPPQNKRKTNISREEPTSGELSDWRSMNLTVEQRKWVNMTPDDLNEMFLDKAAENVREKRQETRAAKKKLKTKKSFSDIQLLNIKIQAPEEEEEEED